MAQTVDETVHGHFVSGSAPAPTVYDAVTGSVVVPNGTTPIGTDVARPTEGYALPLTPVIGGPAMRWRPNSTFTTPVFVVKEKGVECLLCGMPDIGYRVRNHATCSRPGGHQHRLAEVAAETLAAFSEKNAVSLEQAEEQVLPRTMKSRKNKKKRCRSEQSDQGPAEAASADP